jgi:LysM repeat protein
MEKGAEPKEGEVLYMQKKRDNEDVIETAEETPQWKEEEPETFINPHSETKNLLDSTDFSHPGALDKKVVEVPDFHLVQKGDNIYRIAEKYQVFEEDILTWNKNLNPSKMSIGQKIYLTEKAAEAANSVIKKSIQKEEAKDSITQEDVEEIQKQITVDGPVTHIVIKGDTLYNICKRYNVTVDQLKEWNKLANINIQLGQKLQVSE